MRRVGFALVAALVLVPACDGEKRSSSSDARSSPTKAAREQIVAEDRDQAVGLRVTISPAQPHAGDEVSFVAEMTVGDRPYGRGGFTHSIMVEGAGGESLVDSCGASTRTPRPDATPKSVRATLRRTYTFLEPGSHSFSMDVSPSCSHGLGSPSVEGEIDVLAPRAENTHRWRGTNDRWRVDAVALPVDAVAFDHVGFDLKVERKDKEPISWKISYGDGHDAVGGHACRPNAAGGDASTFERSYRHQYNRPGDFRVSVEVSTDCLSVIGTRGEKIAETTFVVGPRPLKHKDAFFLPNHGSEVVPDEGMKDVEVIAEPSSRCVWLKRDDGSRVAAIWPAGFYARLDPLRIYNDKQQEVFREGRSRDIGGGLRSVHVDRIPEQCRVGATAWWVDRLRRY